MREAILAGDVGGTKTNLALYGRGKSGLVRLRMSTYRSREYPSLDAILASFLGKDTRVTRACIGVAGPVVDGRCNLTNLEWEVEQEEVRRALGVRKAYLVNDLQAAASSVPYLDPSHIEVIHEGDPAPDGNIAVLAAGTGLGEGFLIRTGKGYIPLASEGGHVDFAPRDDREGRLLSFLRKKYGRVSVERVLSGPGLREIHRFLVEEEGMPESVETLGDAGAREPQRAIVRRGLSGESDASAEALRMFCAIYGAQAGNLALQYMATGGVYLAGGIAPAILPVLRSRAFLEAFLEKGRMRRLLSRIPVAVLLDPEAPLLGAASFAACDGVLRRSGGSPAGIPPGSRSRKTI